MKYKFALLAAGFAALLASPIKAETLEETAGAFGARRAVLDISLSPAGDKIAFLSPGGHSTEILNVVDIASGDGTLRQILAHADAESELTWCMWASNDRLICQARYTRDMEGTLVGFSRLFSMDDHGGNVIMITAEDSRTARRIQQSGGRILALDLEDEPDGVLMTRNWVPEITTGTRTGSSNEGLGVELVSVVDGDRRRVESPDVNITAYAADETGRVRLKVRQPFDPSGFRRNERTYYYRAAESNDWRQFDVGGAGTEIDFVPVAVSAVDNVAYGYVNLNGFDAIARVNLDDTGTMEVVVSRDDVDVDGLITIGRQQRVVGATYATEKRQIEYIDPELARLSSALQRAIPGEPLVNIIDASADENLLMLVASSDTEPGMIYLFDKTTRQLTEALPLRSAMAGREMGRMEPVSFPAADGAMIPGYLTLPSGSEGTGLPAIVLPHGGPSARDEWGFDWLVQFFVARGYAVLQPNYRGSAGYGDDWFGRNGFQSWRTAIGDVNDAGHWLVNEGIADPDRLVIVGWSYGGYAALQSQVLDNSLYKAVVAIAPVTDLERLREQSRDYTNYRQVSRFLGDGPHIGEGSPARNAEAFVAPVMLFHGTLDQNVDVSQSHLMRDRLQSADKEVYYVEYEGRDHQIDDTWARSHMLIDIDNFLAGALAQ